MNSKMVKCKTCGESVAKTAKACPKCGANQKKHSVLGIVFVVFGIIIVFASISGCGNDEGPKKVDDSSEIQTKDQSDQSDSSKSETEQTTFGVGEQVSLNDVIVTLVSVEESNGSEFLKPDDGNVYLICEFDIQNNSDKDIAVSSMLSFDAYVDDYTTNLSIGAIAGSSKSQLDGTVAAEKKMNGVIGYEVSADWEEIEIRFTPDFWSGKDITFVAGK